MDQFILDTGAALAAAGILAGLVWLVNIIRNQRLETALGAALSTNGIGVAYDAHGKPSEFNVQVSNHSAAMIRVRSFVVVTDSFHISLRPASKDAFSQNPLDNAVLQPKFARRAITRGSIPDDEIAGSMLLPPLCLGLWKVEAGSLGKREIEISHAFLVFEYPNLFGKSTLARIRISGKKLELLKSRLEEVNNSSFHGVREPMLAQIEAIHLRG